MLNANCQLIQCTHIIDLLSNPKGLLDSMIIKVFTVMQMSREFKRSSQLKEHY